MCFSFEKALRQAQLLYLGLLNSRNVTNKFLSLPNYPVSGTMSLNGLRHTMSAKWGAALTAKMGRSEERLHERGGKGQGKPLLS